MDDRLIMQAEIDSLRAKLLEREAQITSGVVSPLTRLDHYYLAIASSGSVADNNPATINTQARALITKCDNVLKNVLG